MTSKLIYRTEATKSHSYNIYRLDGIYLGAKKVERELTSLSYSSHQKVIQAPAKVERHRNQIQDCNLHPAEKIKRKQHVSNRFSPSLHQLKNKKDQKGSKTKHEGREEDISYNDPQSQSTWLVSLMSSSRSQTYKPGSTPAKGLKLVDDNGDKHHRRGGNSPLKAERRTRTREHMQNVDYPGKEEKETTIWRRGKEHLQEKEFSKRRIKEVKKRRMKVKIRKPYLVYVVFYRKFGHLGPTIIIRTKYFFCRPIFIMK